MSQLPHQSDTKKKSKKLKYVLLLVLGLPALLLIVIVVGSIQAANKEAEIVAVEKARLASDPVTVQLLYNALNKERTGTGASALAILPNLTTAADQFCADMVASQYFDYKNPVTGKDANSFITDNQGDLYFKQYVSAIASALPSTQTATDVIANTVTTQATNLNNPIFNSIGLSLCQSPINPSEQYVVGMFAENADKPVAPATVYVPASSIPSYTPPTTCNTTYNDYGGYFSPTATTHCY